MTTTPIKPASPKASSADLSRNAKDNTESAKPSCLDQLQALLIRANGASIAEMTTATGWQSHSVRGAMAGALKKRGLVIKSEKIDGVRRYQAAKPA